jgi:hypothetical protein
MTNVTVSKINGLKVSTTGSHNSVVLKDNLSTTQNKIQVSEKLNNEKNVTVAKQTAIQVTAIGVTPGGTGMVTEPNLDGGNF